MLNFCDFIQVYIFTTNHHLKVKNIRPCHIKGENLRHDHMLITVNIFSIKRKKSATRQENQLHLQSYNANFNAIMQ